MSIEGSNGNIQICATKSEAEALRNAMLAEQPQGDTTRITVQPTKLRAGGVLCKCWTVAIRWD
tara:strand:- start:751 stop:939 length:189 start_codon:yes stop_codon:yes gene_type:complete